MREWRTRKGGHAARSPEQKKRANARSYLAVYLKRGKVMRFPCEVCGALEVEAHHVDYDRPLDVVWLCRLHRLDVARTLKT